MDFPKNFNLLGNYWESFCDAFWLQFVSFGIPGFSQFSVHRDVTAPIKVWWGPIRWVTNRMERVEGVHPCDGQGCWLEWGPHCLIRQYHKIDPPKKSPYFGFPIYRDLLHASANQYQTVNSLVNPVFVCFLPPSLPPVEVYWSPSQ